MMIWSTVERFTIGSENGRYGSGERRVVNAKRDSSDTCSNFEDTDGRNDGSSEG